MYVILTPKTNNGDTSKPIEIIGTCKEPPVVGQEFKITHTHNSKKYKASLGVVMSISTDYSHMADTIKCVNPHTYKKCEFYINIEGERYES